MSQGHITEIERGMIEILHRADFGPSEIGRRIGRDKSVISRELRRNGRAATRYDAQKAQRRYHERRESCRPCKKLDYQPLWDYLFENITQGWTPEQVAGRLPIDFPADERMRISHEAIYQALYSDQRLQCLIEHLAQARPKRRKRGQGKTRRGPSIPNRVGIEQRPHVVEERTRYGDWEGDTVVGAKQEGYVLTLVERTSGLLQSTKLDSKQAGEVANAVIESLEEMPISWVRTITFDNGTEFAEHATISQALSVEIYFAAPYASYQRGTNENTNGLLRRYLPKGTSFKDLTQQRLDHIVEELNNRPRKRLGYRTPYEVFQEQREKHRVAFRT